MTMNREEYDLVVVGGSLTGLLAAREAAIRGLSVRVFEEDLEIGYPDKCAGLVSMQALQSIGVLPRHRAVRNEIRRALLHSPGGVEIEIDAGRQKIVVLDRLELDREIAKSASQYGAEIIVGEKVEELVEEDDLVKVRTADLEALGRVVIDASGVASLLKEERSGILQAARYEIYADWFDKDTVELFFDNKRYPGFFTWIIPIDEYSAKVGVAGRGINPFRALDQFLHSKKVNIIKKIAAPIIISGPVDSFISGRILTAGDAAGQTKPTTAGGIYTCGVAGVLSGQAASEGILHNDLSLLKRYEEGWRKLFGREFSLMLQARRLFERLDNRHLDRLFEAIASSELPQYLSIEGSFDLHSIAVLKALNVKDVVRLLGMVASQQLKTLLSMIRDKANILSGR